MTPDIKPDHKAAALAKLARLQKSPNYRSFFDADAIEAFAKVEGSAFAGTSLKNANQILILPGGMFYQMLE